LTEFIEYVIRGIPYGCVFALVAVGLVLTYKTAGVFNLAFGAQAFLSAAVYFDVRVRHEWPLVPAVILAVFVVAPLVGFVLDRFLFRYLRSAPPIARLVTSIGLLVAIPEMVLIWFGRSTTFGVEAIVPNQNVLYPFSLPGLGDFVLDRGQLATIIVTVISAIGLMLLFRFSALGLRMRAVVESPRMTELAGINADRIGSLAWMLSSAFAGLAGVLLAPLFAQVAAANFTILIVAAIAAAAFGGLTSIPLAFVGGLGLGILQGLLSGYLPSNSVLATGLRPSLPFVVLFLLLIFKPSLRSGRELVDPLGGVDPPPPEPAAQQRTRSMTIATRALAVVFLGGGTLLVLFVLSDYWRLIMTQALVYSTIFLSITVITGMAGQVSLCQATFAAVGAFTIAQLVDRYDMNVLTAMVIGAALAGVVGALLSIPALRLGGIYLSLATLAFALMFNSVLVPLDWVSGGNVPLDVPRPVIGPVDFANDKAFFLFCAAILALVSVLVIFVRRGTTGRFLGALRGSETAAMAIGINPARSRIVAFALSATIAGLGGGLLAMQEGAANAARFDPQLGLVFVVVVVTLGSRSVQGAITAGLSFFLFPEFLNGIGLSKSYAVIFFGLGAITYARHPEGVIEANSRKSIDRAQRRLERRKAKAAAGGDEGPPPPGPEPAVSGHAQ
jgi:branched-subunit amino acid ABC-type transport system permease component